MKRDNIEFMVGWLDALRRDYRAALLAALDPGVVWQGLKEEWVCNGPDEVIGVFAMSARCPRARRARAVGAEGHAILHARGAGVLESELDDGCTTCSRSRRGASRGSTTTPSAGVRSRPRDFAADSGQAQSARGRARATTRRGWRSRGARNRRAARARLAAPLSADCGGAKVFRRPIRGARGSRSERPRHSRRRGRRLPTSAEQSRQRDCFRRRALTSILPTMAAAALEGSRQPCPTPGMRVFTLRGHRVAISSARLHSGRISSWTPGFLALCRTTRVGAISSAGRLGSRRGRDRWCGWRCGVAHRCTRM